MSTSPELMPPQEVCPFTPCSPSVVGNSPPSPTMTTELNRQPGLDIVGLGTQRPRKRARVAIACMRCKARRQKCDNQTPACSNCSRANLICTFADNEHPLHYVRGLENRVAQLEEQLSAVSPSVSLDHLVAHSRAAKGKPDEVEAEETSKFVNGVEVLSLCATAEPRYFGEGSGVSLVQLVEAVTYEKIRDASMNNTSLPFLEDRPFSCHSPKQGTPKAPLPPVEHGSLFLETYFAKIHTTYPFLSRRRLWSIHQNREYLEGAETAEARLDWIMVQLVYAIGARCLQLIGSPTVLAFSPEQLYVSAMSRIDETFSKTLTMRNIEILLLVAIYAMRSPSGSSIWQLCGIMVRQCLELGLHRNAKVSPGGEHNSQLQKRLFWSIYLLERKVAMVLGRPFAIHDTEIEVDTPLEVDDDFADEEALAKARQDFRRLAKGNGKWWPVRTSNVSFHICLTLLDQINSKIRLTLRQIRREADPERAEKKLTKRFSELDEWRANVLDETLSMEAPSRGFGERERLGLSLNFYQSKRMLLQALMTDTKKRLRRSDYEACARASGHICRLHRQLHRLCPTPFSLLDLHSVFVAGFTMVYCVWVDPTLYDVDLAADFGACSTVLYVIAEQWASAKRYRDAYEFVAEKTVAYASSCPARHARPGQELPVVTPDARRIVETDDATSRATTPERQGSATAQPGDWMETPSFREGPYQALDVWQIIQDSEAAQAISSADSGMDFSGFGEFLADEGLGWFCGETRETPE